jgi:hypothetical protein
MARDIEYSRRRAALGRAAEGGVWMKRGIAWKLLAALPVLLAALPASAEGVGGDASQYFSWTYLASVAGAVAATLLIVQYTKAGLDRILKIPTRVYVYVVALALVVLAQGFGPGISWSDAPLLLLNALVVATAAYGSYELTFARTDRDA